MVGFSKDELLNDVEKIRVGVTTYENFYSHEEMKLMEQMIEDTEKKSLASNLPFLILNFRYLFTYDSLENFFWKHSEKNKVFLWVQVYVDQDLIARTIK